MVIRGNRSKIGWCNILNTFYRVLDCRHLASTKLDDNLDKRISSVHIFLLSYIKPSLDSFPPFARTRSSIQLNRKWECKGGKIYLQSGIFFYLCCFLSVRWCFHERLVRYEYENDLGSNEIQACTEFEPMTPAIPGLLRTKTYSEYI